MLVIDVMLAMMNRYTDEDARCHGLHSAGNRAPRNNPLTLGRRNQKKA